MDFSTPQTEERPSFHAEKIEVSTVIIPVDRLEPDAGQPRKHFDPVKLRELADSILADGQLQPIGIRNHPDPEKRAQGLFMIVFGERRWRAHRLAGLTEIRAELQAEVSDRQIRVQQYRENEDRDDLNLVEEAEFLDKMLQEFSKDGEPKPQERMAREIRMEPSTLSRKLAVLRYSAPVRQLVRDGVITQVNALAKLNKLSASEQTELDRHARQLVAAGNKFDVTAFLKDPQKYLKQVRGEAMAEAEPESQGRAAAKSPAPFKATWRLGRAELLHLAKLADLVAYAEAIEAADDSGLVDLAEKLKKALFTEESPPEA